MIYVRAPTISGSPKHSQAPPSHQTLKSGLWLNVQLNPEHPSAAPGEALSPIK